MKAAPDGPYDKENLHFRVTIPRIPMRLPILFLSLAAAPAAWALSPQETEFFEKSVRPVLSEHCIKCHGPEKQKSELRLDSRAAVLKGGDNGPVVVPGKPDESDLIKSIRHEGDSKMPEKEPKLQDEQIAALSEWVRMGVPWPENDQAKLSSQQEAAAKHWSFQPIADPQPPAVKDEKKWAQSPMDQFVLARLEAAGLEPAPKADKRTLIRRATYDLTGLPPTAEEVQAFENDSSPDAFAHVVDRLLASPRYGERWGRYWLDVARYADTRGYLAGGEERRYPYSYTYRDWVISALNQDLPYDQFLIQQMAADLAPTKDDPRTLAALGFITLGRRFLNIQPDIIDDRIDVVCRGTMALTTGCARCHDHKFDPITQKDYYALYGVFASSIEPKDLPALPDSRDAATAAEYNRQLAEHQEEINKFEKEKQSEQAVLLSLSLNSPVALPVSLVEQTFNRADRDALTKLKVKIEGLNAGPLAAPHAMALADAEHPVTPHVFIRGNATRPGEAVPRRFLAVLCKGNPKPFEHGSGRLEMAQSIASKDNPLTARVIVNRVWQHHFGYGIVRTPSDFGVKGEPPTHPEMLDWLASRFLENGWSLKKLHRLILLTSTWQQSSEVSAKAAQADPENRLLSRMNRQRLDFEAIRDSLLFASGKLDLTMGGRGVELMSTPYSQRRAVYGFIDRQNLPGTLRTFDFASPDSTSPQRHVTTVPQQALFMLNSPFVVEQSRALAAPRASKAPSESDVQEFYERVYARRAEPAEVDDALQFLAAQQSLPHEEESASALWQYGWGAYDAEAKTDSFQAFPHWSGQAWQGGAKMPDPVLVFASITAKGGHPGMNNQHAVIRRWIAPADLTVSITGTLKRPSDKGDGVLGRIVSSRAGQVGEFVAEPAGTVETSVESLEVKKGDTVDFLVECRGNDAFDSFEWLPVLHSPKGEWSAEAGFSGPPPPRPPPLTAWERYAQVLLASNEFIFVD